MNYGLLNFKAQNGKPQIFWSNEKTKKSDRKFGYKSRDQRYNLRQYPTDLRTDPDNLLQPVEPPVEEKPKKPAKNFIKRNRDNLAKKNKNKENDQTVTLTQEQLNAILASVGKVASGKEDALRISIDNEKHEIKIDSPGREDGDYKRRHRRRKDDDAEQSIFALVDDNKKSSKDIDEKSRRRDRTPEREDSGDRYRTRKHSGDRDHHRKHSSDRDYRNHSNERYRDYSGDRHRKHSGERYRRDSRERGRSHSRDKRHHSSERYRTPSRERRRHSREDRSRERRKYSPEDRSHERRRHSPEDRSRERRRHSPDDRYRRDSSTEGRYRKRTPERDDHKEKPKEDHPPSPREIAGIPVSLPWKHMTKAERRRLMLAREKVLAEETRKEEEEKRRNYQELEAKALSKNFKKDDYRRDDYPRRDDDRISDSDRGSSLKTTSLPPANTNGKISLGEMKRRQWEKERADSTTTGEFQPWGKPGAGAPIRTKSGNVAADYGKRKDFELERVDEERETTQRRHHSSPPRERRATEHHKSEVPTQETVPAAMRSSIAFGQGADAESMMKTKELERQRWVQELDKQREEKRLREINELNINKASEETWADKFSNPYRPAPLPDQSIKQFGPEEHLMTKEDQGDARRTSSAPNQPVNDDEPKTFIRGQNVFMDSATQKELEEKRKRHLEHQKAIMEQVQEKQRQKQLERERKIKEDMEEEMKLQREREKQQKILDSEIQKNKNREMRRQQQVENLKAAMDEAHEKAQLEKQQKRMQHLEEAGHDVSHLKANLQEKQITARNVPTETARELPTTRRDQFFTSQHYYSHNMADILTGGRLAKLTPRATEPTYVPGLNLDTSPRGIQTENQSNKQSMMMEPYTENRVLTPSQYRHGHSPKREFGTQTAAMNGYIDHGPQKDHRTYREMTDIDIIYKPGKGKKVRVKSAAKEDRMSKNQVSNQKRPVSQKEIPEKKEPERRSRSRKKELWNYQNPAHKRPVKQSDKDLIQQKRVVSEHRRRVREQELLSMVEMNKDRIPTERLSRCDSHSDGEHTPRTDRLCRRNKSHSPEGQQEVNRLVINRSRSRTPENTGRELVPVRLRSPSPVVPTYRTEEIFQRNSSPPVPALKHKMGGEGHEYHGKLSKYGDSNPLTSELGESEFVPFTRTVEILDPAMATRPLPVSREATQIANARKAYIKGMKPGDYGNRVDVYEDRIHLPGDSKSDKDPITNPSLVKNHPTQRQDQILNQLSSLKESLIQRQRELETFSPTDLE